MHWECIEVQCAQHPCSATHFHPAHPAQPRTFSRHTCTQRFTRSEYGTRSRHGTRPPSPNTLIRLSYTSYNYAYIPCAQHASQHTHPLQALAIFRSHLVPSARTSIDPVEFRLAIHIRRAAPETQRPEALGSGGTGTASGRRCLQGRRFSLSAASTAAADVALSGRHCVSREDEGQTGNQRHRKQRRRRNVACWENIFKLGGVWLTSWAW